MTSSNYDAFNMQDLLSALKSAQNSQSVANSNVANLRQSLASAEAELAQQQQKVASLRQSVQAAEAQVSQAGVSVANIDAARAKIQPYRPGMRVQGYWKDSMYDGWFDALTSRQNPDGSWMITFTQWPQWGECSTPLANLGYGIGESVFAHWKDSAYNGWYRAHVISANPDGSYNVTYDSYPQWGQCKVEKINVKA
jgi:hypothetical protein